MRRMMLAACAAVAALLPVAAERPVAAATAWGTLPDVATGTPQELAGAPTSIGVVSGRDSGGSGALWQWSGVGSPVALGRTDSSAFDSSAFWLGGGSSPPRLVALALETTLGRDLTGDGDQSDTVLLLSPLGGPFVPAVAGVQSRNTPSILRCLTRMSAELAVACQEEAALGQDLNHDGDLNDLRVVLIHADGTVQPTSWFVGDTPGVSYFNSTLADGSVVLGPLRVHADGSITTNPVAGGQVVGLAGTSEVVREEYTSATNRTFVVTSGGTAVQQPGTPAWSFAVGNSTWLQDSELCRVSQTGSQSCLGISSINSPGPRVTTIGDDAAVVLGFTAPTPGFETVFVVRSSGVPLDLGLFPIGVLALADGSALVLGNDVLPPGTSRIVHVTATGAPTLVASGLRIDTWLRLEDGRALLQVRESPGHDLNGDGDTDDVVTELFAGNTLTSLGITAVLQLNYGNLPTAVALSPGGAVLVGIDESPGHDLNGDGDTQDMVGAVVDGTAVTNLRLAIAPVGSAGGSVPFLVSIGPDRALMAVWEPDQGADLNHDGAIAGYVTFAVSRVSLAPAYAPVTPVRLLDTRTGTGQTGYTGGKPAAGAIVEVTAPAGADAVVLNLTGVDPTAAGYVTVYPCGGERPTASNLNLAPGLISPNLTITKVGANGKVCIYTQNPTDLVADLAGTFPTGSAYTPVTPVRLLDTRAGAGQTGYTGTKPAAGAIVEVTAPAGADAVVLNVTGVDPAAAGYVTVYPCGGERPTASNLNLAPGLISPNLTITKVGANGKVCIYTQNPTDLVADLAGTFPTGS